ncbi:MAG TPA: Tad domain-containing protein, partial [Chloroflexota bacterium]|nr:Tad domain-containing protein [Chloroflexota bacterium]
MDATSSQERANRANRGQIVTIFALMILVIAGFAGMAIDLARARAVAEDAQRAADAGALAGVVYL